MCQIKRIIVSPFIRVHLAAITSLSLKRREGHGFFLLRYAHRPRTNSNIAHLKCVICLTAHSFNRGIWHANILYGKRKPQFVLLEKKKKKKKRRRLRKCVGCNYALDPSSELPLPCIIIKRNKNDSKKSKLKLSEEKRSRAGRNSN